MQRALRQFTQRYCTAWRQQHASDPQSQQLQGIPSPCIITSDQNCVTWQPLPFPQPASLAAVEQALDIIIQPDGHQFYTTQLAGDMTARFDTVSLTLLQTWSEADFLRVQENLIGHLLTQRRLKLPPTLFIATIDHKDLDVISLCNLTGNVLLETLGSRQRYTLSPTMTQFLQRLEPVIYSA